MWKNTYSRFQEVDFYEVGKYLAIACTKEEIDSNRLGACEERFSIEASNRIEETCKRDPVFREKMKRAEIVSIDVKVLYPRS